MKTYTTTVEKPLLVIEYDTNCESPRKEDLNIGYFLTAQSRFESPDGNTHPLYNIMMETQEGAENTNHHMVLIKERATEEGINILYIYPVHRYEHGNVIYRRGVASGFDVSNCGFYIVTEDTLKEYLNSDTNAKEKEIEAWIDIELDIYTQWVNGAVYRFELYNEDGELEDSCGGLYDIIDIKGYLPEEWKDEDMGQYLNY